MNNIISPDKIRDFYNEGAEKDKDPVHARWGNMPIKRHHYKQTKKTLLNELSKLKNLGDVLEIGCGPATWTGLYIDRVERVTLLDISEGVLEHAKKETRGERTCSIYVW